MSSILTNNGAMVALQTLKTINMDMEDLQSKISTGKKVADASDNSAVWAIAKTMDSDVSGFKAVSESLSLGSSTVAVAQNAAESITDLLIEMKEKIVAANGDNVDRGLLDDDVQALKDQIDAVVGAAQFNGLNLVDGTVTSTDVLSSLDRDASGAVASSSITVGGQNLSTGAYTAATVFATGTDNNGALVSATGDTFVVGLNAGDTEDIAITNAGNWAVGDTITVQIGDQEASYTVSAGDIVNGNANDIEYIANGLKEAIDELGIAGLDVEYDDPTQSGELQITNNGTDAISINGSYQNAGAGGLADLDTLSVANAVDAGNALDAIDGLIAIASDAAAAFGSAQGRIESQSDFVSKLSDSLTSGIGSLVDADMEKASARLKALQTQQQLGAQALSIANSAPQSLLSLFR
ncbi:flagellin [Epibacterium ulvae]|uniref:Flagellin n=1 Tax=Epibacterium ulvae TaxID=1156985 RepID=A0A1G5R7Q0_9RHOB|nr:flagellin [Epibacterium ulvae]SCZ70105.1 flagellin [Epibacterium ulvae]